MKRVLPFLILACFLVLSSGCERKEKKAHLSASVEDYKYSSDGYVAVSIRVVNDGEKDIDDYEVFYRVTYNSSTHDDQIDSSGWLQVEKSRYHYATTFIGKGKTVTDVSIIDVEWEVY